MSVQRYNEEKSDAGGGTHGCGVAAEKKRAPHCAGAFAFAGRRRAVRLYVLGLPAAPAVCVLAGGRIDRRGSGRSLAVH